MIEKNSLDILWFEGGKYLLVKLYVIYINKVIGVYMSNICMLYFCCLDLWIMKFEWIDLY